jgi:flagellar FliL protein
MAKKEVEVEVAGNEGASSGPSMKMLIIVLVVVQLVMFGGLAAFLMSSGILNQQSGQQAAVEKAASDADAIYIPFEPAFTVNFGGASSSRFMQVTIEAMTHDASVVEQVNKHMPVIRNSIVLLLSSQSVESVSTLEGKEKLRQEILANVQKILKERSGKTGIEEIYFTSFVMQ